MVKINLFDGNFPNAPSSVMGKASQNIEYVRSQMRWDGLTIFTDEFINLPIVDQVKSKYKIGWLHEPYCLHPQTYERALINAHKFDTIMTYYAPYLSEYADSFSFAPYAGVWIPRSEWGMKEKSKNVSMLIGAKMGTRGHQIRHEIAGLLTRYDYHPDYYGVRGEAVDYSWQTKYRVLADYRFSIISETCKEDNLFTEWLLDCFAVGTIPVFWGCPNIGKYFDDTGVLPIETAEDVASIFPYLTEKYYEYLKPAAENNQKLISDYEISDDWFFNNVLEGVYV